jgi:hypothetical protein
MKMRRVAASETDPGVAVAARRTVACDEGEKKRSKHETTELHDGRRIR